MATAGEKIYEKGTDSRESEWQKYVADKIRCADRIVMLMKDTDGVRWEFARIISEGATFKTLFLSDPGARDSEDWETLEKMVVPAAGKRRYGAAGLRFPVSADWIFFHSGRLVEIVNANRTATSYRTAFSHFLAEPLAGKAQGQT